MEVSVKSIILALSVVFLSGCGMDFKANHNRAIDTLSDLPISSVHSLTDPNDASYEQLEAAINELAPPTAGSNVRGLFGRRKANMGDLRNLFTMLKSGKAQTVDSLAYGLVDMNGGSVTRTAASVGGIFDIIKIIGPIIGSIFPGLAPIIEALMTILPAILSIFGIGG